MRIRVNIKYSLNKVELFLMFGSTYNMQFMMGGRMFNVESSYSNLKTYLFKLPYKDTNTKVYYICG